MPKPVTSGCPVLPLARRFEEFALQLDDAEKPDGIENAVSLGIKMAEIGEAVSHLSPKTRAGAAFQIMLASAEVDSMQTAADPDDLEASKLMVQRLLYRSLEMMRNEV